MNDKPGTDEVTSYVRDRMKQEPPPDFVAGVMSEVRDTPQHGRRWTIWPVVAGLATVAAAVAVVGVGLTLLDRGGVGSGETVIPSPSVVVTPTEQPGPSAVATEPPVASAPGGPHGPVWQPAEPLAAPASCRNLSGMPTAEYGGNVAYAISYPGDWFTAESYLGECLWFAPEPWPDAGNLENVPVPDEVAILITVAAGDFAPTGTAYETQEYTVAGLPALRYSIEAAPGSEWSEAAVVWVIGVDGRLPSDELLAPPYLMLSTSSSNPNELAVHSRVLDQMVATLEVLEP
jgi:hypothetical protein